MARTRRSNPETNASPLPDSPDGEEAGRSKFKLSAGSIAGGRFVVRYLRPYRWKFLIGLGALFASSLAGLAFPALTGTMIDATSPNGPKGMTLNEVTMVLLGVLFLQSGFGYLRAYLNTEVAERVISDLRQDLYRKMIRLPMQFFHTNRVGDLTSRLGADVAQIQFMITTVVAELLRQSVIMIGGVVLVSITSFRLTLIILTAVPILVVLALTFGRMLRKAGKRIQDLYASLNTIADETFQGIAVVKSFTAEARESARYGSTIQDIIALALKIARGRGAFTAFVTFVLFGGVVGIIWYGGGLVLEGLLSIGELTAFVLYALFVGAAMGSFADLYASFQGALGASERIRGILEETEEDLGAVSERIELRGDVELREVSYAYPTRPDYIVLSGISFSVTAGSSIALVGASGAGKSTIAALLMRFYQPTGGDIFVDGKALSDYPLGSYRSSVGIVPQDVLLFGGTIRENIRYGAAAASHIDVQRAAELANAAEFIESFPDGYDTIVGERGVQLSGGQRQRIAIARAIIKDPAILILDEATSSLDAESEGLVQEALQRVMKGRTTFIIAHRLSTIRNADAIAVLARGVIIEQGTYEGLTRANGVFARLVAFQNRSGSDLIDEVVLLDRAR